jgi:hypothetical protein
MPDRLMDLKSRCRVEKSENALLDGQLGEKKLQFRNAVLVDARPDAPPISSELIASSCGAIVSLLRTVCDSLRKTGCTDSETKSAWIPGPFCPADHQRDAILTSVLTSPG